MLRSLSEIDSITLARYRADPCAFIEENLVSPYTGEPYRLTDAERFFIKFAFTLDADGRLLYPLLVYGAIKKSRKTELAALLTITLILLYGGRFAEGYIVANDLGQAIDRCFTGCRRIIEASPLLCGEAKCTYDKIIFTAPESTISAIPNTASGLAGGHPTLSVFDEMWQAPSGERGRAVYDQLIPVPSRKISARLVVSHAGLADSDHLLYQLYERGMKLPEVGKDLRAGDGMLMHWSHVPQHDWQNERWLQEMRRELTPAKYTMMIENRPVSDAASFITNEMFDHCVREGVPQPGVDKKLSIIAAVDAAPLKDHTALIAIAMEDDDTIRLVRLKVFKPSENNPLDFEETIEKTLLAWAKKYNLRVCVVDPREMYYVAQRLRRAGLKVEEMKQTPDNLTAMAQDIFERFRTGRFIVDNRSHDIIKYLRNVVTRMVFEETTGGLRFAKHQPVRIDAVTALAMAGLVATQRSDKSAPWDIWDDPPTPPLPPEELIPPVQPNDRWWERDEYIAKHKQPETKINEADEKLASLYAAFDQMIVTQAQAGRGIPFHRQPRGPGECTFWRRR